MEDSFEHLLEMQRQFETAQRMLAEQVIISFKGKSIAEIKMIIQDDTADILGWLLELGVENECYEISAAARKVIAEREMPTVYSKSA